MSTLSEGNEIELRFYHLKAQEWAVEVSEAKRIIEAAMEGISQALKRERRHGK